MMDTNNNNSNSGNPMDSLVSGDLRPVGATTTTSTTTTTTLTICATDQQQQQQQQASDAACDDELQFINHIDDYRSRFGMDRGDACEILALTLAEAHVGTCSVSTERITELIMEKKQQQVSENKRYNYLRSLSYEELWFECADRLTKVIQNIIEFAKVIPSFMLMEQDDQIALLKAGIFEMSCLRISRYYDLETNQLLFGNGLIPMDLFIQASGKSIY